MLSNKELKELHKVELEILDEIDKFCKKHKIKYFLVGGTLLGAVRHKGFIPWDDDLDIAMFREDYDKFILKYSEEKNDKYYVQSYETDKNYWNNFAKVRKRNTLFEEKRFVNLEVNKEIFVDIFPIDVAPSGGYAKIKIRSNIIKLLNSALLLKRKIKKIEECNFKLLTRFLAIFSTKFLAITQHKLMTKDKNLNSGYRVEYCSAYAIKKEYVKEKDFFPLLEMEFEGKKYPVPHHYKEYLSKIYGDYMKLPPKEKRVTHNVVKVSFNVSGDKSEK